MEQSVVFAQQQQPRARSRPCKSLISNGLECVCVASSSIEILVVVVAICPSIFPPTTFRTSTTATDQVDNCTEQTKQSTTEQVLLNATVLHSLTRAAASGECSGHTS